jgi:hypothetical protein
LIGEVGKSSTFRISQSPKSTRAWSVRNCGNPLILANTVFKREFTMHHDSGLRSRITNQTFQTKYICAAIRIRLQESHDCPASSPGQYPRVTRISRFLQHHVGSFGRSSPIQLINTVHYLLVSKAALALSTASFAFSSSAFPSNG